MRSLAILVLALLPTITGAADIKAELILAARRLGAKTNYSWTQTRVLETTNVSAKNIFPVNGEFDAPAQIHVAQHELQPDWEAMWKMCGITNTAPLLAELSKRKPQTNELVVVADRCAIKGQYADGCMVGLVADWTGYLTPRPPQSPRAYYISLNSPPHIEIGQLISAAAEIARNDGTFILTLDPNTLVRQSANRSILRPQSAEGWAKLWVSNAIPIQYETRIVETVTFNVVGGPFPRPGPRETDVRTNHTLTRIHSIGATKIQIPPGAQDALKHPGTPGAEP